MNLVNANPVILKQLTFLQGVDDLESAYALAQELQEAFLPNGATICVQGQPADATYFVLEGAVRWERRKKVTPLGEPILRHQIGENRLLGHHALLYGAPYPITATADGSCRLLRMGNRSLDRLIYRFPAIRRQMMPIDTIGRLRTIPWLAELDIFDISLLAEEISILNLPANHLIYDRDESMPDTFYVIDQGQVKLLHPRRSEDVGYLGNGAVFGISPLLGQPRYSNIAETLCQSRIFAVPRSILDAVVPFYPDMRAGDRREQREQALADTRLFAGLDPDEIGHLVGYVSHINIPPPHHHLISLQREAAQALWLLMPGSTATLHVLDDNEEALSQTRVTGPMHFGEGALLADASITSTIEADPGSQWLKLDRQDFLAFDRIENGQIIPKLDPSPGIDNLRMNEKERQRVTWLAPEESLRLYNRRHWVVLLRKLIPGLILSGIFVLLLLANWGLRSGLGSGSGSGMVLAVVTWGVSILAALAWLWGLVDYWNDFLFVTNRRVVQQDKVVFFSETRREASLNQIQDIVVKRGFIGNFLGYGGVVIQTAAKEGNIIFDYAPDPDEMQKLIFAQMQAQRNNMQTQSKLHIQEMLEGRLGIKLTIPDRVLPSLPKGASTVPTTLGRRWRAQLRALWSPSPEDWASEKKVVWRQHWIIPVSKLATPVFLLVVSLVLGLGGLSNIAQSIAGLSLAVEVVATVVGVGALIGGAWIVEDWRNDTYELTDRTIADISKLPLFFSENRRQAQLSEIQDIQFDIPSPIHYLLNFGYVRISTAATGGIFTFDRIPDPASVVDEIRRRIEKWRFNDEAERNRKRSEAFPDWFEIYKRLDTKEVEDGRG